MSEEEFYLIDLKSRFDKIKPNTYYLSYSGGKDSHFLYWFIKEYLKRDDIKIVGVNTFMEHHEILKRILNNCDVVLYPSIRPMEIKNKYGIPCFSKEQDQYIYYYQNSLRKGKKPSKTTLSKINRTYKTGYGLSKKASEYVLSGKAHKITHLCCHELKKNPTRDYEKKSGLKPILGVRGNESVLRKKTYQSCFTSDKKFTPIYDLSNELLNKIYNKYNIEIPKVYNHICRTGCMGCPYGSYKHDTEKELLLINDNKFKFVTEYFKESYEVLGIDIEKIKQQRKQTTIYDFIGE